MMRKTLQISMFLASGLAFGLVSGAAFAGKEPGYRPYWSSTANLAKRPNCSFLGDLKHSEKNNPLENVVESRTALRLKQELQDMNRDYELKQTYGLLSNYDEQNHTGRVEDFGRGAFNTVRSYQFSQEANRIKKAAERNPTLRTLAKPAVIVGTGAAIYSGTPINVNVDEDTRLHARTDVPNQKGELMVFSSLVNGGVEVNMAQPATKDPTAVQQDPTVKDERYRFSLSRGLPIWDLASGVSYGSTTTTVSASLSKRLSENLTAVVDTSRPVDPLRGATVGGESLKLLYGLQF